MRYLDMKHVRVEIFSNSFPDNTRSQVEIMGHKEAILSRKGI